ncbi:hypothetical protein M885DRAFT_505778 [Pelagophyceae sp. CCMP2097]|nr:hypothetical protein M885DRAFT_505778 [Pelagophyceae sp. CCMP2097]
MVLSEEHKTALADAKNLLRADNDQYIEDHPELRGSIRLLMAKLLDAKPDDLTQFVCEFFTQPDLERQVDEFMQLN